MFGFGKKKMDKDAWAEAIYGKKLKHPEKESAYQLSALTTGLLLQYHRIILDSVQIIRATKNPDTRKGRIELSHKHHQKMLQLKPFCNKEQLDIIRHAEDAMRSVKLL